MDKEIELLKKRAGITEQEERMAASIQRALQELATGKTDLARSVLQQLLTHFQHQATRKDLGMR